MRVLVALALLLLLAAPAWAVAADQIPSFGSLPATVPTRVFGSAPPMTLLLSVFDSDRLIAVNAPLKNSWNNAEPRFLSPRLRTLPVLGGWHGDKQPNLEEILLAHPDLIVAWDTPLLNDRLTQDLQKIGIPCLRLNIDQTDFYPQVFRTLGSVLGKEGRAERLARYAEEEIRQLQEFTARIPPERRVRFYYAESQDGFRTDCDRSFHAEPFHLAGGQNIWRCTQDSVMGMAAVTFEQIMQENPEVIIAQDAAFMERVHTDATWKNLQAVQRNKVFLVPRTPFNWIDRPPSFMRILGAHWLAATLYPEIYPYDIRKKAQTFFQLFFGVSLSEDEMKAVFP
jgi:iron complex transport system substrate-binding protein